MSSVSALMRTEGDPRSPPMAHEAAITMLVGTRHTAHARSDWLGSYGTADKSNIPQEAAGRAGTEG